MRGTLQPRLEEGQNDACRGTPLRDLRLSRWYIFNSTSSGLPKRLKRRCPTIVLHSVTTQRTYSWGTHLLLAYRTQGSKFVCFEQCHGFRRTRSPEKRNAHAFYVNPWMKFRQRFPQIHIIWITVYTQSFWMSVVIISNCVFHYSEDLSKNDCVGKQLLLVHLIWVCITHYSGAGLLTFKWIMFVSKPSAGRSAVQGIPKKRCSTAR
jgi:hypothetical protein